MSNYVEKCENNVESERYRRRDWDCNSSSGGSVYQELLCRTDEVMYSTDDEFMDATETIGSPLLSGDPEDQVSAPILKQLRQEKEETRYTLVDMVTDSESVNNITGHDTQNVETIVKQSSGEIDSDDPIRDSHYAQSSEGILNTSSKLTDQQNIAGSRVCTSYLDGKTEKNKCSRTLRLPSTVAMPAVKPDRPARGDGRPPVGVSKIPVAVPSLTKRQQISNTSEQNSFDSENCQIKSIKQPGCKRKSYTPLETPGNDKPIEDEVVPECLDEMNTPEIESCQAAALSTSFIPDQTKPLKPSKPPSSNRPPSNQSAKPPSRTSGRPSPSLTKEDRMDTGIKNVEPIISKDAKPSSHEKPRIKRALSQNKNIDGGKDAFPPLDGSQVSSTNEGAETKRMRVANKLPSREEPEKHLTKSAEPALKNTEKRKKEIQAIRDRLGKERLNLMNTRERNEVSSRQSQMIVDNNFEHDPLKSENTQKSAFRKSDSNAPSHTVSNIRGSSSSAGSEKNIAMHEKVPITPRHLSPIVRNTTLMEKRQQWRQSRESVNGDPKPRTRKTNMPEIKPPLFKSNQLKTNQLGQRQKENLSNAPMKSSVEEESLRRKTTLTEKRKMMMRQKDATNNPNKPATGDSVAQQVGKGFERASREKPTLAASQKRSSNDIRKPSSGVQKSTENTTNVHTNIARQEIPEESASTDIKTKPSTTSANSKSALASMQNVYKIHYKRCEEQLSEVKRSKDKLGLSLEKLEALRSQMIQKFGEDAEELTPPLYVVQCVKQNSPTVLTTAKGMNTEVLEESIVLRNNGQGTENIRMNLEEANETENANKKDEDSILEPKQRLRDVSLTLALVEKRQQTLEEEMKEKQKEINSLINQNKQLNDYLREKDQIISMLKKQTEEKSKELEIINQKLTESKNSLQQEVYKVEVHRTECQKQMMVKNKIEKELQEMGTKFADFEEREECLNTMLENEKKNNKKLEELLCKKEEELNLLGKKFFEVETSSSSSMKAINDQLQEKETIIGELEIMKTSLQDQISELCCFLSDIFASRGIDCNIDHIQALLSSGSLFGLREKILKVIEEEKEESNEPLNEAKLKIVELQKQVKVLEIELEDTKVMSERLTNVIPHQNPWDTETTWEEYQRPWSSDMVSTRHLVHTNLIENSVLDNKSLRDRDVHSLIPSLPGSVCSEAAAARNNFKELFLLLERKRKQLLQLERKYQDIEEVHSHCQQKRTRNETRIAQLEMMLAKSKNEGAAKRRNLIYLSGELELLYRGMNVTQLEIVFDDD